ncbi:MAG: hypothetical protein Rubg2KO_28950 [Rubricoccaceae bacterium]
MRPFAPAVLLGISLAACTAPATPPPAEAPEVGLAGIVRDADRQPVAGAFVTARDSAAAMSISVRTDAEGRYHLPIASASSITVHAIGLADDDAVAAPALPARLDLSVTHTDDVFAQLPSSSYYGALPDGETKRQFILDCGGCHQFNRIQPEAGPLVQSLYYWENHIGRMLDFAGAESRFPIMAPSRDEAATAEWLTQHLGTPGDPLPVLTPPPFELARERVLITEYDVPSRRDLPHDLMPDANGQIIVTGMNTGQMYSLDPVTGAWTSTQGVSNPRALAIDANGVWWVLLGAPRQILRLDPATGDTERFDIGVYPHSIALAEDGRVWFNAHFSKEPETMGVLDPATGEVATIEVPTPRQPDGGSTIPYGLRIDADGVLWGTQLIGNRLVRYDPATEQFGLYELPTPHSGPRRPDIGPDGRIWIPEFAAGKLAVFDPATEAFSEFALPVPDALPYIVRVDPSNGMVWVATGAADAVLRFDPSSTQWTVHPLPTRGALVRHMELGADGSAWVAYGNVPAVDPKVAHIELLNE